MKNTDKIEQAKTNFEYVFGRGFFDLVPVGTFTADKSESPYYHDGKIYLNTNGFEDADLYHEAAHALDDLLFSSEWEFGKFFTPFYKQLKKMDYFEKFMSQYDEFDRTHECFAESVAMALCHPDTFKIGYELVLAVLNRLSE